MILKLLSINLWNYNHFEDRFQKIISFIKETKPDVIALQEVRDDSRRNHVGNNQLLQLNKKIGYAYHEYFEYMDVNRVNKSLNNIYYDTTNPRVMEGLGLLSIYPIVKTYSRHLKKHKLDKYPRGILCARIKSEKTFDIFVVHYSADDLFSKLHLEETLEYARKKFIKPIIVGDFNMRKTEIAHEVASQDYVVSRDRFKYYSYPSKKETLDYILIPKEMSFKSFKCVRTAISDHSVLLAEIVI